MTQPVLKLVVDNTTVLKDRLYSEIDQVKVLASDVVKTSQIREITEKLTDIETRIASIEGCDGFEHYLSRMNDLQRLAYTKLLEFHSAIRLLEGFKL